MKVTFIGSYIECFVSSLLLRIRMFGLVGGGISMGVDFEVSNAHTISS